MKVISMIIMCLILVSCALTKENVKTADTEQITPIEVVAVEDVGPNVILVMDKKVKTNLLKANYGYGADVPVLATSPKSKADSKWFVSFPVVVDVAGNYELGISLAGKKAVPFDVVINDNNVLSSEGF